MNKLIYTIIFSIYLNFAAFLLFKSDLNVVLGVNVFADALVLFSYINFLKHRRRYLFPSSMFVFSFYIYAILGKCIWIYRENYWFNESGNPNGVAIYFSIVGILLVIFSAINLNKHKIFHPSKMVGNDELVISIRHLTLFTAICFVGAFLFTNRFKYIPIFETNMDSARVLLINESEGGRGLGFMLLLFGVIAVSMALLAFKQSSFQRKIILIGFISINLILLSLYSGRFLPMIPFVLYLIITKEGDAIRAKVVFRNIFIVLAVFSALMYFGAKRAFGDSLDNEMFFRFLIGDSFPEFRMTVYGHYLTSSNFFENFFFTILSGSIPSSIFEIFGLNKFDYFRPIGAEILKVTHFDPVAIPGIRTSLFGELSFTGWFILVFIFVIYLIFLKLDSSYLKTMNMNFKKYSLLVISIFLAFSIPYGSMFLIGIIQISIILYILKKYAFRIKSRKMRYIR